MGKWLARVIGEEKPQETKYQNPSKTDTDKTDKISHLTALILLIPLLLTVRLAKVAGIANL